MSTYKALTVSILKQYINCVTQVVKSKEDNIVMGFVYH